MITTFNNEISFENVHILLKQIWHDFKSEQREKQPRILNYIMCSFWDNFVHKIFILVLDSLIFVNIYIP